MRNSKKWKNWVTLHDEKTCTPCKQNNGKIYEINEVVNPSPPLHHNCRCKIEILKSIFAGEATNKKQDGADWYLSHWSTIRTRLKASIFGGFWIVVLERHEHSFVLRAKNPSKIQALQVEEFKYNKNFCKQGKSTANT